MGNSFKWENTFQMLRTVHLYVAVHDVFLWMVGWKYPETLNNDVNKLIHKNENVKPENILYGLMMY